MALSVRDVSLGRDVPEVDESVLIALGLAEPKDGRLALTRKGATFDDAWTVYRNEDAARELRLDAQVEIEVARSALSLEVLV